MEPKMVVEEETENQGGTQEIFNFECIDGRVVGWPRNQV